MVTIEKNGKVLSIPSGAYEKLYAQTGWKIVGAQEKEPQPEKVTAESEPEVETEEVEEVEPEEEEEEYEEIEVDPEELLEKPLEDLDLDELRIVAEYLDIDTEGLKSGKALRAAIRKARK